MAKEGGEAGGAGLNNPPQTLFHVSGNSQAILIQFALPDA